MFEQFQAWFDGLGESVTIQKTKQGQTMIAVHKGGATTAITRPTFVEAAEEMTANLRATTKLARV